MKQMKTFLVAACAMFFTAGCSLLNPGSPAKVHATTFLRANAGVTTHVLMSPKLSDAQRDELISYNKSQGYGVFYVYLANEGDYGGKSVSYDAGQKDHWRKWLSKVRDSGADVVVWMCADDSPGLARRSDADWRKLVTQFHKDCGDLVASWVTGLECDEVWKPANGGAGRVQGLTRMIKDVTGKKVGVHTTGISAIGYAAGADAFYLQTGFNLSAAQVAAQVKAARSKFSGTVYCAEYHKSGETDAAKAIGDAAIAAGASGVGNGCSSMGLSALRGDKTAATPDVSGPVLKSVAWRGYPNVAINAPVIEGWDTAVVDNAECVAILCVDGKKCEWVPKGRQASSVKNAMNPKDKKYYRPDIKPGSTHAISLTDVNGKNESNRINLTWP